MIHAESLPADLPLTERIVRAMPDLTPAQQRMAAFVLENTFRAATMRIDEFANAVGVSLATVNRFARALGFDGYPQCRAAMVRGFEATLAPIESLRTSKAQASASADVMAASLAQAMENLDWTRRSLDAGTCERAVDAILHAHRIYVVGLGASGYLAGLLHHGLDPYCENVQAVVGAGGSTHAARQLFKLREGDLVIALAFPRYVSDTITLCRRLRGRGVPVLVLTDSPTSPLAPLGDIVIFVRSKPRLSSNSEASVLAMIDALCDAVAQRAKHAVDRATELTDFLLPWLDSASLAPVGSASAVAQVAPNPAAASRVAPGNQDRKDKAS
ncbi:MurR/RpiR family transcriptional regulator [Pandoraea nosoerga]|uniref:HTH-type transcriptional regulator HexR n=1 Tax=Pandoraea nosoerga TaxID=2508296 RepID=A0A5E4XUV6_9BURK|nr:MULTISPECIES: MurR/RpiR family transcriptional regulator [Pandoraea]MBN4667519.1 MurR/RpiR family transcriptional regulator [Pandoraea nosoerga]MBN4674849.1 MurR/RpiR family transcriptional regulator [Pandoraea nosoerga]MBN4680165.1 MurR/RpiR family transcriptional regulator [Pandoraea nosoerga]MBN4744601.1 MurR/RpiR family transcriptional regulator [Pandoraea nosoerga]VVE40134.1 HTH-type transcriptional regulator HexR [Pandoraea nosoerga]